jgi:hypothetical protein
MPFHVGPAAPTSTIISQLVRGYRAEPFGHLEGMSFGSEERLDSISAAVYQLLGLMNRLTGILEVLTYGPPTEPEDDFMKGWGEDDLEAGM